MKLETFSEKFELFADAPDAVAKMRELVLRLAVRGHLVPQNPKDEPAFNAIERLVALNGSGRTGKLFPKEESLELPFGVPGSWEWVRFGDLVRIRTGKLDANAAVEDGKYPFFTCSKTPSRIATYSFDTSAVILAGNGDFNLKSYSGKFDAYQRTYVIEPLGWELRFCFWLISAQIKRITDNQRGSAIPYLRLGDIADPLVPFPPLAEQKRIVAKVDELMELCDRLEAQQQEREKQHTALARASLSRFAEAPTPANLNLLFHKSYDITPTDLRKTILTLAVQGKLAAQEAEDGDARFMIDRAIENRHQTIKFKSLRRKELDESATLFQHEDLPPSWCVERLANLVDPENTISYGVLVPGNDVPHGIPFVRAQDLCLSNHPAKPNKTIAPEIEKPYARTRLKGGEILLCVVGSIGKLGTVPDSWAGANIARAVARIKPISEVTRDYLLLVLQEQSVQNYFTSTTRTLAQPTLNVGMIEQTPIPVAPLAEQRRIVARVEQLMALVDGLETQLAASRADATKLLSAAVSELTQRR